jgi:hypothetical protein
MREGRSVKRPIESEVVRNWRTPAFMKIEGRVAARIDPQMPDAKPSLWTIPPWLIAVAVIVIMLCLMVPGFLLDLERV